MTNKLFTIIFLLLGLLGIAQEERGEVQLYESDLSSKKAHQFDLHFFEALKFKATGDQERMIEEFEECLEIDPKHPTVNYELGLYYLNQQRTSKAQELLLTASHGDPTNKWIAVAMWELSKRSFSVSQEREALERLIVLDPHNPEYLWECSQVEIRMSEWDSALVHLNKLEEVVGFSDMLLNEKVLVFLELGDFNSAENTLTIAVNQFPDRSDLKLMLVDFYEKTGQMDKANILYQKVIKDNPNDPNYQIQVASSLLEEGLWDSANVYLIPAFQNDQLSIDPKIGVLAGFINAAERNKGIMNMAIRLGEIIVSTHPENPKGYALLGDLSVRNGDRLASRNLWKKAVTLPEGDKWVLWSEIMQADAQLEMWDSLHVDASMAIDRYPNQPICYLYAGVAENQRANFENAIQVLEDGQLYAYGFDEIEIQLWLQLGNAYGQLDQRDEALDFFEKALEHSPSSPLVLNNFAFYLADKELQLNRALSLSKKAVETAPNQFTFWDTYAWVLFKLNRFEEALDKIDQSIRLGGSRSAEVIEHKGDILFALGRKNEAIQFWKDAIELGAVEDRIQAKIQKNE